MLIHIALFKFKENVSAADQQAALDTMLGLKNKIPAIAKAYGGRDCLKMNKTMELNQGYTHTACLEFADEQAFIEYLKHPAQHDLNDIIKKYLEDVILTTINV